MPKDSFSLIIDSPTSAAVDATDSSVGSQVMAGLTETTPNTLAAAPTAAGLVVWIYMRPHSRDRSS